MRERGKEIIMTHNIKIRRALQTTSKLPMAQQHILRNIPTSVIDKLTSSELAELINAMDEHFKQGELHAECEINDYIGLPVDKSLWDVIGDDYFVPSTENPNAGERIKFADGLNIADILQHRVREIVA